jgi:hypothetical protein
LYLYIKVTQNMTMVVPFATISLSFATKLALVTKYGAANTWFGQMMALANPLTQSGHLATTSGHL